MNSTSLHWGTKAENLHQLASMLKRAHILPQICFTIQQWQAAPSAILEQLKHSNWLNIPLIVRSSALNEDTQHSSLAGHYCSVADVSGPAAITTAIHQVIDAYDQQSQHQVLIQPMLPDIKRSGVMFTRDPNTGSPYLVINFDEDTGRADGVTSGHSNHLKTRYIFRLHDSPLEPWLQQLRALAQELETFFPEPLDIEFAFTTPSELYLLQVRPLKTPAHSTSSDQACHHVLTEIAQKIQRSSRPHPYLHGTQSVYGIMPDWNPAEMIGVRPRPLALSLYRELITDSTWAYQRDKYGYRNLRSFPLMLSFGGSPYIDVRVSFNSFLPAHLDHQLGERLINYYLQRLLHYPNYHDKVEFEIIYSCYTLDLPQRLNALLDYGFTTDECHHFAESLRLLTNPIIHTHQGFWREDIEKIHVLEQRLEQLQAAQLDKIAEIYWLIEDCKRYGTLPFAGLARAGFIAIQMLHSLVRVGILNPTEYTLFLRNLNTISSKIGQDFQTFSKGAFLKKYGHLRPGTYDILSPRYDQTPDRYFDWETPHADTGDKTPFVLTLTQLKAIESLLKEHQLEHDVIGLFDFIKEAIEGREYAKFIFTRSLSQALLTLTHLGQDYGIDAEACSYLNIQCIRELYTNSDAPTESLWRSIHAGKNRFSATQQLVLPPLITQSEDVWNFELNSDEPNYITLEKATGPVRFANTDLAALPGCILLIPSADPGYDWIFSHAIAGLITMYGGANSHMAIRAGELGIPAIIGAGELLYQRWSKARVLDINCQNRQVRILQ